MKFKKIPVEYFPTLIDRLTRFKPAHVRYKRVFDDIINKFSLDIKLKNIGISDEISIVEEIIDSSLQHRYDDKIQPFLLKLEERYFKVNELSYQYLSSRINYTSILSEISDDTILPKNANFLRYLNHNLNTIESRKKYSLLYPIEKILICEGETERLLLPIIGKLLNVNFDKLGILLISAGGKNQVARKYYSMSEYTKLPFNILLDKDATSIKLLIDSKLRPIDSVYLINSGEFEDLLPVNVLVNAINYIHKNDLHCLKDDFAISNSNVINIENIYKKYGFGEYKKAHFANSLKKYIELYCTKDDFIDCEIPKITDFIKN